MTARTASLRVAHQKGCPNKTSSAAKSTGRGSGCTCSPKWFTVYRGPDGKQVKSQRRDKRADAQADLNSVRVDIDRGRGVSSALKTLTFSEWADQWLERKKATTAGGTVRSYTASIELAKKVFGDKPIREIATDDLEKLQASLLKSGQSKFTVNRHLRQVSVCFTAAYKRQPRVIESDPFDAFTDRVRPGQSDPTYFSDEEIPRLLAALRDGWPPVYEAAAKIALTTGCRVGELAALRWQDVNLSEAELRIREQWNALDGFTETKSKKQRTVDLTPAAIAAFGDWLRVVGVADDEALVFPSRTGAPLLQSSNLSTRVLNPAMKVAGIPKNGPEGRPRTWHSLRHTFARVLLERETPADWVSRQMGHSAVSITVETYGRWARSATKATAASIPADAFAL
jgi:integrase